MGRKRFHGSEILKGIKYDFSINLNPFGTPESISDAMSDPGAATSYPDPDCLLLRESISQRCGVSADNIVCGSGVSDIIYRICSACGFRRVLLAVPAFTVYERAFNENRIECTFLQTGPENGFVLNGEYLNCGSEYDAIFTADPANPSGGVMSSAELNRLMEWCEDTDTVLVIDESYMDFTAPELFDDYEYTDAEPETIFIRSFVKTFAMPGTGIGFAVFSSRERAAAAARISAPWTVSELAQRAASAALEENEFVKRTAVHIERERNFIIDELRAMGLECFDSCTNYILFKGPVRLGEELREEGFLIRDCSEYPGLQDIGGLRYYRTAVRLRRENTLLVKALRECMSRRKKASCIVLQGSMNSGGKRAIAEGLCRLFAEDGYAAAVFEQPVSVKPEDDARSMKSFEKLANRNDILVILEPSEPSESGSSGGGRENAGRAAAAGGAVLHVSVIPVIDLSENESPAEEEEFDFEDLYKREPGRSVIYLDSDEHPETEIEPVDGDILAMSWNVGRSGMYEQESFTRILSRKDSVRRRKRIQETEQLLDQRMAAIEEQLSLFRAGTQKPSRANMKKHIVSAKEPCDVVAEALRSCLDMKKLYSLLNLEPADRKNRV